MNDHKTNLVNLTVQEVKEYYSELPELLEEHDVFDYTPVMGVCQLWDVEKTRILIDLGADINYIAPDGESALNMAIPLAGEEFTKPLFDLLISNGVELNTGLFPPLETAIVRGLYDLVEYLIRNGADPNYVNADGGTPLFSAGANGKLDIKMVGLLLKLGADENFRNCLGKTMEDYIGKEAMSEAYRHKD